MCGGGQFRIGWVERPTILFQKWGLHPIERKRDSLHREGMSAKAFPAKKVQPSELKVLIICEDLECGKHAKELQDQLLQMLASSFRFIPQVWTFRALQDHELQGLARKEINEADIILLSTRGDAGLPTPIRKWLEVRLAETQRPRALVALFGPAKAPKQVQATRHYLEEIASRRRLQFFVEPSQPQSD